MLSWLFGRVAGAVALLGAVWGCGRAAGFFCALPCAAGRRTHGAVRILKFYATTGSIAPGDKAQLCYGVANASQCAYRRLSSRWSRPPIAA